jgi:tetratricopeptide (TPR) repeat protein
MRQALLLVAAVALGGAAHVMAESAGAAKNAGDDPDRLMYLPEGRILRMASLGHRRMLADLVWLRTIQYYGEQKLSGRNYDEAERLFQVIYDLDGSFHGATRFGALILSQDANNPDAALRLLRRAQADHPSAWEYVFDEAFVLQTILRDYESAAHAYRRASTMPGAPEVAARLAGLSFARLGDRVAAREVWWSILSEADNDLMKQVAERNLMNLDLEDMQDRLTAAARRYREDTGRLPADWRELAQAGLAEVPATDPFGGAYFLDGGTGEAWSTTYVDRRMSQVRNAFAEAVQAMRATDGRYPASLAAVVERGFQRFPPWKPFGITIDYDPATGVVSWNPPWPEIERGKQGRAPA